MQRRVASVRGLDSTVLVPCVDITDCDDDPRKLHDVLTRAVARVTPYLCKCVHTS